VTDFIEECATSPNGAHDDQVDAMTQALLRWNMIPRQTVLYVSAYECERYSRISLYDRLSHAKAAFDLVERVIRLRT
jgi:hypothetical protein